MKKIIKKTPITLRGVDFYEVLMEDDSMGDKCACDLCCYNGSPYFDFDLMASCIDIHGCTMHKDRYFLIEPL